MYQVITNEKMVMRTGEAIYSEGVTRIGIDDECGGPFLVLRQSPDSGDQELRFDPAEWLYIVAAAAEILAEIGKLERADG